MNVLILSQYFWPENFRINELVNELDKSKKINIEVLTAKPSYPSKNEYENKKLTNFGKIKVHRLSVFLRNGSKISIIFNYISFVINATIFMLFLNKKNMILFLYFKYHQFLLLYQQLFIQNLIKPKFIFGF